MRTIALTTAILAFGPTLFAQQVKEISTSEALLMIEQGAVFIDVREADEVASIAYPVTGALNIPSGSLANRQSEIPKTGKVILACNSGYRSGEAVKLLAAQGYDNLYGLKGGILQWQRDGQPVVRSMAGSSAAKACCAPGSAKTGCAPGSAKASCAPAADGANAQACCADGGKKGGKGKKGKKGKEQCCAYGAPATPGCCEKK
ncbi:MAG: rhodanese-like domain-containing protein [Flavobacteriales bacterium]|nr:rhodanese-like domain-containing protein [Flavobacteriales bacterium]